jgi:N-acetylglucosamine-6-phosphate deacetylase
MPAREPAPADDSYRDATLLPGLVDLQVNGADGAAYDAAASEERARATAYHVARGTTSLLATLVSAPLPRLQAALERAAPDVDPAGPVVGLHLEGPFLAAAKSGAHTLDALVDPTPAAVDGLIARAAGALRMVTLAPELPGALDAVARFARAGAVVAAGHSQASTEELRAAVSQGLDFVTHVGNASDWPSRPYDDSQGFRRSEPGLVGTFLFEPRLRGSLILDGFHLHPELARAIVELRGADSVVLVSDATPAAGLPAGRYQMGGLDAEIHAEGYATAGEGLAGSVITLLDAVRIAVERAGIALATAVRMASATPAHVIGVDGRKGALAPGRDADLLVVGSEWDVRAVYRLGEPV